MQLLVAMHGQPLCYAYRMCRQLVILNGMVALNVTGFTKTVPISTRNEIQFIADYYTYTPLHYLETPST